MKITKIQYKKRSPEMGKNVDSLLALYSRILTMFEGSGLSVCTIYTQMSLVTNAEC